MTGGDVSDVPTDPYTLGREDEPDQGDVEYHAFWADEIADLIEERGPEDPIIVKGGISPSGVPHLGNVNEIMRGYFVAEVLRERGHEVRQVFTSDDRDPLRKLPRKLADLDGNVVDLGDVDAGALGRNLGKPYTDVPDPFGCCDSYGDHFSSLIERSAELLGVPIEVLSTTDLYESGEFEGVTRFLLEHREEAREVLAEYQEKVDESYVPFRPICANCGIVTGTDAVTEIDLDAGVVHYECGDIEAGDRVIEGCGHRDTATLREGKLPWRFEWPAEWQVLGVDFEPFGKDHAEGSWPSGEDVARNVLGIEPPVPMVYEWFTLNGEPFSSSAGNVILVSDVLEMIEPEVLRYFFSKDPNRARDFDVSRLDLLVDEFDRFERIYFGEVDGSADEHAVAKRVYPLTVATVDWSMTDGTKYRTLRSVTNVGSHLEHDIEVRFNAGTVEGHSKLRTPLVSGDGEFDAELLERWARLTDETFGSNLAVNNYLFRAYSLERAVANEQRDVLLDLFAERIRLPYTFAAVLGMTDDPTLREQMVRNEGHVPHDAPEWVVTTALARVPKAREWAERTNNEYDYRLSEQLPVVEFDPATEAGLDELAAFVAEGHDGEAIQGEIYETAKRHDVPLGEFFGAGYQLFLGQEQGPKLGPFLAALDREFVVRRLRREG